MNKDKKSILILTPFFSPNLGGVETHLDDLCEYLIDDNYKVFVLTYQPLTTPVKGKPFEKKGDLEIYRFKWISGNYFSSFEKFMANLNFLYLTPYLLIRTFIFFLSHKDEIDIIHAFGLNASFIARCMKIIFKKKIIMSTEALYEYKKGAFFTDVCFWVLNGFDKILAQSESSKEEMINIGIPKEKINVFVHWINEKKFKPEDKARVKRKLGWQNKFTVLYLGRLIPKKGIRVFLDVVEKIKADIAFKIIGDDGPELPAVKEAENKFNNLKYIGRVPYQKLPPYYAAADIFIYPALYEEDMSRAILESLSSGTPVINSNKGSGIYSLDDSVAIIVKPDANIIAEKLNYFYRNPVKLKGMNRNCRKFARKFCSELAKTITDSYDEIYDQRSHK